MTHTRFNYASENWTDIKHYSSGQIGNFLAQPENTIDAPAGFAIQISKALPTFQPALRNQSELCIQALTNCS